MGKAEQVEKVVQQQANATCAYVQRRVSELSAGDQ
jgi:hypothetical protein